MQEVSDVLTAELAALGDLQPDVNYLPFEMRSFLNAIIEIPQSYTHTTGLQNTRNRCGAYIGATLEGKSVPAKNFKGPSRQYKVPCSNWRIRAKGKP